MGQLYDTKLKIEPISKSKNFDVTKTLGSIGLKSGYSAMVNYTHRYRN